jgi:hypothetical protein
MRLLDAPIGRVMAQADRLTQAFAIDLARQLQGCPEFVRLQELQAKRRALTTQLKTLQANHQLEVDKKNALVSDTPALELPAALAASSKTIEDMERQIALIPPALSAIDEEAAQLPAKVDGVCWRLMLARVGEYRGTLERRLDAALQRIAKACGPDLAEVVCLQQAAHTLRPDFMARVGKPIEHGPVRARHAEAHRAARGRVEECRQFIDR